MNFSHPDFKYARFFNGTIVSPYQASAIISIQPRHGLSGLDCAKICLSAISPYLNNEQNKKILANAEQGIEQTVYVVIRNGKVYGVMSLNHQGSVLMRWEMDHAAETVTLLDEVSMDLKAQHLQALDLIAQVRKEKLSIT